MSQIQAAAAAALAAACAKKVADADRYFVSVPTEALVRDLVKTVSALAEAVEALQPAPAPVEPPAPAPAPEAPAAPPVLVDFVPPPVPGAVEQTFNPAL